MCRACSLDFPFPQEHIIIIVNQIEKESKHWEAGSSPMDSNPGPLVLKPNFKLHITDSLAQNHITSNNIKGLKTTILLRAYRLYLQKACNSLSDCTALLIESIYKPLMLRLHGVWYYKLIHHHRQLRLPSNKDNSGIGSTKQDALYIL